MIRSSWWVGALLPMVGCTSTPEPAPWTEDIRVDEAADTNNPDSEGTRMCVTDDGYVYVMWVDNRTNLDSDRQDIWLNRSVNRGEEGTWLPSPVKVNQGDLSKPGPGNVWAPQIHCDGDAVYVVWEDDRDGELENHQIYFNRSLDNGETFQDADTLLEFDDDGTTMSIAPQIVGFGQDLAVAWQDGYNGAYDILVATSGDAGLQWRDPIRVDSDLPGSAFSAQPRIAMSENAANIWVVWEDSRDGNADIYFARSTNAGVTFEDDQRLDLGDDPGSADSFAPQICTDHDENIYVVWHDSRFDVNNRDILYQYSADAGDDWLATSRRMETDGEGFANSLYPVCVGVGPSAHVAWQDNRFQGFDVFYREIRDGIVDSAEEARVDLGNPEGFANSLDVAIAFDNSTVGIAWNDGRTEAETLAENGYTDLFYNYADAGAPFEDEVDYRIDSMYDGQSFKLDVNFAILGGEWYAAWTDGRGGTSDIYFQRMALGDEALPPVLDLDSQ